MIGTQLAQYRVIEKIGAGGMGEVYRARDTRLDRDVALKILPGEFAESGERVQRFEREAKAVAALSHPNILSIYDFGSHEGVAYAVMEYLQGETLADSLLNGALPPRKVIEVGVQVADGLAAAHERGIIHRDLKPANIFLTTDGRAKILDFGLARVDAAPDGDDNISQSPTIDVHTDPGTVMGTVGYMSPEQVRGAQVDSRADIFSLGAVLYEMLTGTRPFRGDTTADVIGAILRDDPSSIREKDASIPEGLGRIVQHCLEKNPAQRFQSARDLSFALANASAASQSDIAAFVPEEGAATPRSSLPWIAAIGWALAVVLFALSFFDGAEESVPARLTSLTYSGRDWAPDVSPDGDIVAFVSDRDGVPRIWIKQLGGGGEEPLTGGADDTPRFSPDGSQVLFVRDENGLRRLYRTPVVGGAPRRLLDDVLEADWSPDGKQVAFLRMQPIGERNVVVVGTADAQTGSEHIVTQVENRSCYGIRWSPTGDVVAWSEGSLTGNVAEESHISLLDLETGEVRRPAVTDWPGPYTAIDWAPSGRGFLVGQSIDVLAHTTGLPAQIMECDLDRKVHRPLFWSQLRLPRAGWGFTTVNVVDATTVVLDDETITAELREVDLTESGGGAARVITRGAGHDRQPHYAPDGSEILFSSNRSGNMDIWSVNPENGTLRQVTDDAADDWDPAITPDGRQMLWSSNRRGNMEIWLADRDGGRARQVTNDGVDAENPTMTRDGNWIVYASSNDENLGIWKIRPDGTDATLLSAGSFLLPEVSPDGRYALFCFLRSMAFVLQVVEIESGETVPFEVVLPVRERHQNVVFGRARWSPDGKRIFYVGQNESGQSGIYVQDFVPGRNTRDSRRPVAGFSPMYTTESLGVSPDGTRITISVKSAFRTVKRADNVFVRGWH